MTTEITIPVWLLLALTIITGAVIAAFLADFVLSHIIVLEPDED